MLFIPHVTDNCDLSGEREVSHPKKEKRNKWENVKPFKPLTEGIQFPEEKKNKIKNKDRGESTEQTPSTEVFFYIDRKFRNEIEKILYEINLDILI